MLFPSYQIRVNITVINVTRGLYLSRGYGDMQFCECALLGLRGNAGISREQGEERGETRSFGKFTGDARSVVVCNEVIYSLQ